MLPPPSAQTSAGQLRAATWSRDGWRTAWTVRAMNHIQNRYPELEAQLQALGPDISARVWAALGVPYGQRATAQTLPINGFHLRSDPDELLLYVVTPTTFTRYQITKEYETLTVTVPVSRITRVLEFSGPGGMSVVVEMDADALTTVGIEGGAPGASRTARATYAIEAPLTTEAFQELSAFAVALRSAVAR